MYSFPCVHAFAVGGGKEYRQLLLIPAERLFGMMFQRDNHIHILIKNQQIFCFILYQCTYMTHLI